MLLVCFPSFQAKYPLTLFALHYLLVSSVPCVYFKRDPAAIEVASSFFKAALERKVLPFAPTILQGDAMDSLKQLAAQRAEPFDAVFIDADKKGILDYVNFVLDNGLLARCGKLFFEPLPLAFTGLF